MARPDYEDSIVGNTNDAGPSGGANTDNAYFGRQSSLGRVTEANKGKNLRRVFGTRVEDHNEPA